MHASQLQMQRVLIRCMERLQTVRTVLEEVGLTMCTRLHLVNQVVDRLQNLLFESLIVCVRPLKSLKM